MLIKYLMNQLLLLNTGTINLSFIIIILKMIISIIIMEGNTDNCMLMKTKEMDHYMFI
jgi:hypothetical protein